MFVHRWRKCHARPGLGEDKRVMDLVRLAQDGKDWGLGSCTRLRKSKDTVGWRVLGECGFHKKDGHDGGGQSQKSRGV